MQCFAYMLSPNIFFIGCACLDGGVALVALTEI
jgi:hypothetical protein